MATDFIHIGFGNIMAMNRVIAILSPGQEPTKRLIREARDKGMLIDATHARKAKAVLILDNGYVAIAAISSETIAKRLTTGQSEPAARAK